MTKSSLTLPTTTRRRPKFCRLFDASQQVGQVRRDVLNLGLQGGGPSGNFYILQFTLHL